MKLKLDKEFLVKHRFWILLGTVPLLWLIACLVLSTAVAEDRNEKTNAYKKLIRELDDIKQPKNENFTKYLRETNDTLQKHKRDVWKRVWKSQNEDQNKPKPLMTWPKHSSADTASLSAGTFGADIPVEYRRLYAAKNGLYYAQLDDVDLFHIKQPPKPTYYLNGWYSVMQPVEWKQLPPTVEECWLAQEALWVQRELLTMVQAALDGVAQFDDVTVFKVAEHEYEGKENAKLPDGITAFQISKNPDWELELVFRLKTLKELEMKETPPDKEAKPDDKNPPAEVPTRPEGDKEDDEKNPRILVLDAKKSNLKNINSDKKTHPLEGLRLRLTQPLSIYDDKGNLVREVTLEKYLQLQGKPLEWNQALQIDQPLRLDLDAKELAQLKLKAPVQFNYKEKIDVQIVEDKSDPPLPKGCIARQRLQNPSWEFELFLENLPQGGGLVISAESKIKNIHPHQRTLTLSGTTFLVGQQGQSDVQMTISKEPLAWGESAKLGQTTRITTFNPKLNERPLKVKQVLEWASSPIKRIDEIQVGYNSHRTAGPGQELVAKKFGTADPNATTPTPDPSLPNVPIGEDDRYRGDVRQTGNRTPNNLERNRYYPPLTDQVRRIPLGMVLVVDQANVQDVLTAFSNCRLRIQPTQVHWQRITDVRPYDPAQEKREGEREPGDDRKPGKPPFVKPPPTFGKPVPEDRPKPFPGPFPGPGPQPGVDDPAGFSNADPNVVQLSIYGIASLYERYREEKPADAPTTPGKP